MLYLGSGGGIAVDAVTSDCVINLVPDEAAAFGGSRECWNRAAA